MPSFRITRPTLYKLGSIGHDNVKARQGHYFEAEDAMHAVEQASEAFPTDALFDVQTVDHDADSASSPVCILALPR